MTDDAHALLSVVVFAGGVLVGVLIERRRLQRDRAHVEAQRRRLDGAIAEVQSQALALVRIARAINATPDGAEPTPQSHQERG